MGRTWSPESLEPRKENKTNGTCVENPSRTILAPLLRLIESFLSTLISIEKPTEYSIFYNSGAFCQVEGLLHEVSVAQTFATTLGCMVFRGFGQKR